MLAGWCWREPSVFAGQGRVQWKLLYRRPRTGGEPGGSCQDTEIQRMLAKGYAQEKRKQGVYKAGKMFKKQSLPNWAVNRTIREGRQSRNLYNAGPTLPGGVPRLRDAEGYARAWRERYWKSAGSGSLGSPHGLGGPGKAGGGGCETCLTDGVPRDQWLSWLLPAERERKRCGSSILCANAVATRPCGRS